MKSHNTPAASSRKKMPHSKSLSESLESVGHIWVSDIMQKNPITVRMNETLDTASALLSDHNIRHLPVIDKDRNIQGILSDRDLLNTILRVPPGKLMENMDNMWSSEQVKNVMSKTPEIVSPETNLIEAGMILLENKISCLPVCDDNYLVGIITSSDFVKLVCQGLGETK